MREPKKIPYVSPILLARTLHKTGKDFCLLHSSLVNSEYAKYSYLAYDPVEKIISDNFKGLESKLTSSENKFTNAWFGYLAYDLKNSLEKLPIEQDSFIKIDNLYFTKFANILVFDHGNKICTLYSLDIDPHIPEPTTHLNQIDIKVLDIQSNMSKNQYLEKVNYILEAIKAGDLYQANLTRKFYGNFESIVDSFEIFAKLCNISPAPYSCFLKINEMAIISSSPEQFLNIDNEGNIVSRPIKGSAPRFDDIKLDEESFNNLKNSTKDRSENLMIVDLMRNDLSRSAITSSVKVDDMFKIDKYETIFQMSSTIMAKKLSSKTTLDVVKSCFPPGSMTGAPKIKAMQLCSRLEQQARGLYSGAIGFFGGDGSCNLSVVIRTLIVQNNKFEFQVGGGIVADSIPLLEWEETMIKAKALTKVLNLQIEKDLLF